VLPLAWFYISLVVFLYVLLLYSELRTRARRHVKGCPSLPYISPARLDSLIAIEPDLYIVELSSRAGSCEILQIQVSSECQSLNLKAFFARPLAARFSFSTTAPQSQ
jgi:hypothetical protein